MTKIPTKSDLDFLIGNEVLQVCIGANELIINFQGETSITVTAVILFSVAGVESQIESNSECANLITKFIQKIIKNIDIDEQGGLEIIFDGNDSFKILKNNNIYESYTVFRKGNYIVC